MADRSIQIHFALAQPFAGWERRAFPFHRVHYRRPLRPPAQRQRLAVLLILLVNGLCLLGVGRWLYQSGRLARAEETGRNYLQASLSSSKVNHTSATKPEVKGVPAALTLPPPSLERPVVEPVRIELPPPELPLAVEPLPLRPVDAVAPLDSEGDSILAYSSNLAPHQGDAPMLRNWKLFELAALLAVAAPSPIVLAGGGANDNKEVLERLEKIVKEVRGKVGEVKTQVDTLGASLGNVAREVADLKGEIVPLKDLRLKIDSLERSFARLKTELEDLRIAAKPAPSLDRLSLEDLKERLMNIEKTLTRMQTETRTSLSPAVTTSGKIMLINSYTDRLLFRINGREFFVQPGQSQVVEGVPAGPFTYQVMTPGYGWSESQTRTLDANRTFTLNAQLP